MKISFRSLSPHAQIILHDVGLLLHIPGGLAIASLPICFWFDEQYGVIAFLITAIASFSVGQLLYRSCRAASETRLYHAMIVVAISWLMVPLLGTIPFAVVASQLASDPQTSQTVLAFQDFLNDLFESMSGFTSTGLTMTVNESQLPHSLQWWRSLSEWIGGVGMVVLILSVLDPNADATQLYNAEARKKHIARTLPSTVRRIWWIYLFYTGLSILLLRVAGMPWWDAINHGLTGIATGGFSIKDDSLASYSSLIKSAAILVMIAGAISFPTHYRFLTERRLSALWQNSQHRLLWIGLSVGAIALSLEAHWYTGSFLWLDSVFQWVSALGTCGFETVKLQTWSPGAKLLLSIAMVIGGTAGSTVGGLKLSRAVSLYKGIVWRLRFVLKPDQPINYRLGGDELSEAEAIGRIESAAVLAALWLGAIAVSIFVLLHVVPQASLSDVIFESTSALGSVGLSVGISTPDLHWLGRCVLILLMWMGRLEIIPVLMLFASLLKLFQKP